MHTSMILIYTFFQNHSFFIQTTLLDITLWSLQPSNYKLTEVIYTLSVLMVIKKNLCIIIITIFFAMKLKLCNMKRENENKLN